MATPQWITPAGILGTFTQVTTASIQLVANSDAGSVVFTALSGEIPNGISLSSSGLISGSPTNVVDDARFGFVVRATNNDGITDRTFYIDIVEQSSVEWVTTSGALPIGLHGRYYIINKEHIFYQLRATTDQLPSGQQLRYYIAENAGTLPEGIVLTEDGILQGYVNDTLQLIDGTYAPKIHVFTVTATNGEISSSRQFSIQVEHPRNLTADAGYIDASTTIFEADTARRLIPTEWLTPVNLGEFRSDNKQIISFANYDPYPETGPTSYYWNIVEPIGSLISGLGTISNVNIGGNSSIYVQDPHNLLTVTSGPTNLYFKVKGYIPNADNTLYRILKVSASGIGYKLDLGVDTNYIGDLLTYRNLPRTGNNLGDMYKVRSTGHYFVYKGIPKGFVDVGTSKINYFSHELTTTIINGLSIHIGHKPTLPPYFTLDETQGFIYANIPYQSEFSKTYSFVVSIVKTDSETGEVAQYHNRKFTLTIKGANENTIQFTNGPDLGTLYTDQISTLQILASNSNDAYPLTFTLIGGYLPPGLRLTSNGMIVGKVPGNTILSSPYSFLVKATDSLLGNYITQTFTIEVVKLSDKRLTRIFVSPFIKSSVRDQFQNLMTNSNIFDRSLIYRYGDLEFGVQRTIKMYIEFGIQAIQLNDYIDQFRTYFYNKRYFLGDVKVKSAIDSNGKALYDVVYVELIDPLQKSTTEAIVGPLTMSGITFYPNSTINMQHQLESVKIEGVTVEVNNNLLPDYMKTIQEDSGTAVGFMLAAPLCYTLPGSGSVIADRIKNSGFDFKMIDFEIDRIFIENNLSLDGTRYLVFPKKDELGTNIDEELSWLLCPDGNTLYDQEIFTEDGINVQTQGFDILDYIDTEDGYHIDAQDFSPLQKEHGYDIYGESYGVIGEDGDYLLDESFFPLRKEDDMS